MNAKPKNQHWVPRFYLKHFATPDTRDTPNPKVCVIDKKGNIPEPRLTSTKEICGQRYLYTPKNPDGNRDWSFEGFLGELEHSAAGYWEALAQGQLNLLEPNTRTRVAEFLAALHLRNKLVFDLTKSIMRNRDALFGGPQSTERPKHLSPLEEAPDPANPARFFVQSSRNNIPRITKTIASYDWLILRSKSDVLLTSDIPFAFINSNHRRTGPGSKNAEAIFPVTPRTLLYMKDNGGKSDVKCANVGSDHLRRTNKLIYYFADRFIIAGIDPGKAA